ncbi:hypothetical protein GCM10023196_078010 [Actinoallomurus vinaceus]|uniref:Secreted protein n=1 Tax=Actinoallomurus vinaceus TaxID=1080074 RepID=A0ABP8ULW1_9ACTN
MRRIATLVATGAVAAAAAITLAAAPASAASAGQKAVIGRSLPSVSATGVEAAISYHYWQIGGTKKAGVKYWGKGYDVAGVYTHGKYGTYKGKLVLYVYGTDTKKDGKSAGIEIKGIPGDKYPRVYTPKKGKKTFSAVGNTGAKYVYIREVLGHKNGAYFDVTKAGKWKQISV